MRRQALALLASSILGQRGDGLRRPLNAPPAVPPAPGVQPGSPAVVIANRVIVFGPAGSPSGVFVYAPGTQPGLGNPPREWMTESTVDPFGNPLPSAGDGTQNAGGQWSALFQGGLLLSQPGNSSPASIGATLGQLGLVSPSETVLDNPAVIAMLSSLAAGKPLPSTTVNGTLTATSGTAADPTVITTDTWHAAALLNGWANVTTLKYSLLPDRMVMLAGVISSAGAAGNPLFMTLPAGYAPATQQETAAGLHGAAPAGGAFMRVATTGDVSILGSTAATGPWSVSWTFSLDYA